MDAFLLAVVNRLAVETKEDLEGVRKILITPLSEIGTPRQITGKPVHEWTPQDHQRLQAIFHTEKCPSQGLCDYCYTVGDQAIKDLDKEEGELGE